MLVKINHRVIISQLYLFEKTELEIKNTEHKLGVLVQMKGLAPLRYHAKVANDGCPSFVADKQ